MRLTSSEVHLSKPIHNWLRHLSFVPYRAIIYAFFSKRAPMTVTWSNFVNNTLYLDRLYACLDAINVNKIGPRNRHWGAFAERCIDNRTIRQDTQGRCQSCIVLERCTFGEVSRMRFILFLCVLSRIEGLFGDDVKNSCLALL